MADRLAAAGVLLVGGASSRFGSPKALATFRGETLAERGWRTLEEVFEEVIAVGKAEDGLDLPFPILDDGSEGRAPVFGVLAALRAASNDVCVVLPVDCPLVTGPTLRLLAEAGAIPRTGPLPGAYAKEMLPALERRVAEGELSLRGMNSTVVAVDEVELLNVNTRMDLIVAAVADWALPGTTSRPPSSSAPRPGRRRPPTVGPTSTSSFSSTIHSRTRTTRPGSPSSADRC